MQGEAHPEEHARNNSHNVSSEFCTGLEPSHRSVAHYTSQRAPSELDESEKPNLLQRTQWEPAPIEQLSDFLRNNIHHLDFNPNV